MFKNRSINRQAFYRNSEMIFSESMPTWKKYARIILPHVGLVLLSFFYVIGGAFVFYHVERLNEIAIRKESLELIEQQERLMLEHLWIIVNDNETTKEVAERIALEHVDNVSRLLFDAFDTHYISLTHLRNKALIKNGNENYLTQDDGYEYSWTMTTAIFFTTTLLTTIGYGNLVPVTATGRLFCIFYALLGVPLILITVADIGKFLSEKIIWLYALYTQTAKRLHNKKKRYATSFALSQSLPTAMSAAATVYLKKKENGEGSTTSSENEREKNSEEITLIKGEDELAKHRMRTKLQELGIENYVSIPIALIAAILLGYMTIGAVLLANWENWRFFEGFYFSFITMTTVGFGDIVPIKQHFFFFDLFYIIVGLAITTMCIDLVGIEYIEKIHYFNRAIRGARFALVNVGGKMVRVPNLVRCAYVLHQKYGQKKAASQLIIKGAYTPKDLGRIHFIDYCSLNSFDSFTTLLSNKYSSVLKNQKSKPALV